MMDVKQDSFALTSEYLKLLLAENRLAEMGADAPISDINRVNHIRMEVNIADELIRRHIKLRPRRDPDPDLDVY